jgi:hypothetical protein
MGKERAVYVICTKYGLDETSTFTKGYEEYTRNAIEQSKKVQEHVN